MIIRPYTPADFPTLHQWWTAHGWTPVSEMFLPARGLVIDDTAAVFIYHDPTACLAGLEWWVTNPQNTPLQSARAIAALAAHAETLKPSLGILSYFTTCKQQSLSRLLQAAGFQLSDQNMIHLIL